MPEKEKIKERFEEEKIKERFERVVIETILDYISYYEQKEADIGKVTTIIESAVNKIYNIYKEK